MAEERCKKCGEVMVRKNGKNVCEFCLYGEKDFCNFCGIDKNGNQHTHYFFQKIKGKTPNNGYKFEASIFFLPHRQRLEFSGNVEDSNGKDYASGYWETTLNYCPECGKKLHGDLVFGGD